MFDEPSAARQSNETEFPLPDYESTPLAQEPDMTTIEAPMKISWWTVALVVVLLIAVGIATVAATTGRAGGQTGPPPPLVTDYANYPDTAQAQLPAGCDFAGVLGVEFFLLHAGATTGPFATLTDIPAITAGDTLTMTWAGVTEACVGVPLTLDIKDSIQPFFVISDDQPAVPPYGITYATTTGAGSVSLVLPPLGDRGHSCNGQVDAVVGIPLAVVGPAGSYYNSISRGDALRTTLISARNGTYSVCEVGPPPTTTTTGPTTTTTTGASTTTGPTTTTTTGAPAPTTVPAAPPTTGRLIPNTGAGDIDLRAAGGVAVILAGLVGLVLSLRLARRPQDPTR